MHNTLVKFLNQQNLGLFIIRVALAAVFITAGWMKLASMDQVIGMFAMIGLTPFFAWLVALVELVGGVSLLLGIFTRYAGIAIAVIMVFAIVLVKGKMGFMAYQSDLVILAAALGIALLGPGRWSLSSGTGVCACCDKCKDGTCNSSSQ